MGRVDSQEVEEFAECMRPKTNDDIVLGWDYLEGSWNAQCERDLHQLIMYYISESAHVKSMIS
jgi:hypothetical protein